MTTGTTIIHEQLRLFQAVASLYQAGIMALDEGSPDNPILALKQFLFGYAYERQGRSPAYAPIARHAIETIGATSNFWQDEEMSRKAWELFCSTLKEMRSDAEPNPKNNPLCPKTQPYLAKSGPKKTSQPSVLQFIQDQLKEHKYNIAYWAKHMLLNGRVQEAHSALCGINGIGPKIASFFLRDVAWRYEIQVVCHRDLLQPIDVWVQRTARQLDPAAKGREAVWIVEESRSARVLPEAVNAGLWYFGALIAGSEFQLFQALNNPQDAQHLVDDYVARLQKQVDAWSQEESFLAEP